MSEIDYALAWDFIDPADAKPASCGSGGTSPPQRPAHLRRARTTRRRGCRRTSQRQRDEIAISRPGISFDDVEAALAGWKDWATLRIADNGIDRTINLARIRDRIRAKGPT